MCEENNRGAKEKEMIAVREADSVRVTVGAGRAREKQQMARMKHETPTPPIPSLPILRWVEIEGGGEQRWR